MGIVLLVPMLLHCFNLNPAAVQVRVWDVNALKCVHVIRIGAECGTIRCLEVRDRRVFMVGDAAARTPGEMGKPGMTITPGGDGETRNDD